MESILTLTINPAIDITLWVDELVPRRKLRSEAPRYEPGGGGVNVSRVVKQLGGQSTAFVARGGPLGALLEQMLSEAQIETRYFDADGMTRPSLKVFEHASDNQFRFVPPGPQQRPETATRLRQELFDSLDSQPHDYVVGSGSLPPGVPDDLWASVAQRCRERGMRFVLDTSGPALAAALDAGVHLVKMNRREARSVDPGAQGHTEIARRLVGEGKAEVVVVTLAADGALVVTPETEAHLQPPPVDVVSTVGAGDTFLGALMVALADDRPLLDACRYGVAGATATVTTEAAELCSRRDTDRLFERVEVRELVSD